MNVGEFQTTALAIYSIRQYAPVGDEAASELAVARAVAWLKGAKPSTTQDRAFQLLGLAWGGATPDAESVRALGAMQQADGGWSQLANIESDAYATGTALVALHHAGGLNTSDPVYQRGLRYLLKTQQPDGTWHVVTRSKPIQKYFETGCFQLLVKCYPVNPRRFHGHGVEQGVQIPRHFAPQHLFRDGLARPQSAAGDHALAALGA